MALPGSTPQPEFGGAQAQAAPQHTGTGAAARSTAINRDATQRYQRAQIESASPTRLIVLLYEGAIRFCSLAQEAMRNRDFEAQNNYLIKAQRIVTELLSSLNRSAGGDVATNLVRIYTHLFEELVKANLYDRPEGLDHSVAVLTDLRATWVEIDRMASSDGLGGRPAPAAEPQAPVSATSRPAGAMSAPQAVRALAARSALLAGTGDRRPGDRLA